MPAEVQSVAVANGVSAPPVRPPGKRGSVDLIDIRREDVEANLRVDILSLFQPQQGQRQLPTVLLYDKRGLQLFEEITYLDEYYLTGDELAILQKFAADIAREIPAGAMLVELGSGNLRKINVLLQALEDAGKAVDYFALDLSEDELERTLHQLPRFKRVSCHGLLGTYDDGREWLARPCNLARHKCVLSLGASIGNFDRPEASEFLKGFADVLGQRGTMLIGLDACSDPAKIYHAYNDKLGLTHRFVLNGLDHANAVLGKPVFDVDEWRVVGEYVYDGDGGRHRAVYSPVRDVVALGHIVKRGERIQVEQSLKYSPRETNALWEAAGLKPLRQWSLHGHYGVHLVAKQDMSLSRSPGLYAGTPLPSLKDWDAQWATWDLVTGSMLPAAELLDKPIKLRNACIFYLGHIPAFLDIQLTKTTGEPLTEPACYRAIFERGVDPDVDNPEHCHAHSEIPDDWPPLASILAYQASVRDRLRGLYAAGQDAIPRHVGRAVWLGFEHELMHLETLLYMMLQSDKTLPPPHVERPDFEALAARARAARVANQWFDVPARDIDIGLDDPDDSADTSRHFGWDNEKPLRRAHAHAFQAKARPITVEEYALYLYSNNLVKVPAGWIETGSDGVPGGLNGHRSGPRVNGDSAGALGTGTLPDSFLEGKAVRTVHGAVPLKHALDWPAMASYDELAGCAAWMGGRVPTFEEARSIYAYVDARKQDEAERQLGKTVPAVNGHLSNGGVEETPPPRGGAISTAGPTLLPPRDRLFTELDGANVGFQHWHPVPVTAAGDRLAGQAGLGGVWEWTSTPLAKHEGFKPMALYPGYTADFFDGKHNIVLGGSWATHPRIAGRKSFINWYQRNYPYVWAGARLVRDLPAA